MGARNRNRIFEDVFLPQAYLVMERKESIPVFDLLLDDNLFLFSHKTE